MDFVVAIEPERMNSPLENREVRLRGLLHRWRPMYTAAGIYGSYHYQSVFKNLFPRLIS
ncbi:MAG TPA: hypothetical protein VE871_19160 [Longimicrobium sp.]|nr:hypothetical protein [Longimicrobium sp.]